MSQDPHDSSPADNAGAESPAGASVEGPADSRRRFLLAGASYALATGSGLGLAGCSGGSTAEEARDRFGYGVASGDPLADRVMLWTRINRLDPQTVQVQWEIATDAGFLNIVNAGMVATGLEQDYTVKVDATGLQPATSYFYRFRYGTELSETGRTRTLPVGSVSQVRMAVFSCAAFPIGQFHVYADAARRGDIDVAVHLGDYIYETGLNDAEQLAAGLIDRTVDPKGELLTLSDYRQRYALYHTDADLRALRATMPLIAVWDDHEIANEAWRDGAGGHDPAAEGSYAARRVVATRAYHEWLPTRLPDPADAQKIYRSFDFGNLVSLNMLDTRLAGRDAPLTRNAWLAGGAADPARQLLGNAQASWLDGRLQASGATWQVLGQQVLMGRMLIPLSVFDNFSEDSINAFLRALDTPEPARDDQQRALVAQQRISIELNDWNGFQAARERVLASARSLDRNLVVLSGDSHNAWASNLRDASGTAAGVEFGVPSVTSTGLELAHKDIGRQFLADSLVRMIADLKFAETSHRGYVVATFTPQEARAEWIFVSSVLGNSFSTTAAPPLRCLPGAANRVLVGG